MLRLFRSRIAVPVVLGLIVGLGLTLRPQLPRWMGQVGGVCGNGTVESGENCDDGNTQSGDCCSSNCAVIAAGCECPKNPGGCYTTCGDGIRAPINEVCDDGNQNFGDGCRGDCQGNEVCGDGLQDEGEQCDDGNTTGGDGCSASCRSETCGDGVVIPPEQCDTDRYIASCDIDCTFPACGDGRLNEPANERCDDSNVDSGDGCNASCGVENGWICSGDPSYCYEDCGDGQIVGAEVCDDGNQTSGDGCRSDCRGFEQCGDGYQDENEQCDDGNTTGGDGCSASCRSETCGDGVVIPPEQCDTTENIASCDDDCTLPQCGDGQVNPAAGEVCDDWDTESGDGCSSSCSIENGWACSGESSWCYEICGDAIIVGEEVCDDGNETSGDGCSADCRSTEGCGNGYQDVDEECDDGNTTSGDGCSAACRYEFCGDGIRHQSLGEECDDGNETSNDGCDTNCTTSRCGNGVVAGTEQCDDGNTDDGDGCSAACQTEVSCGCSLSFDVALDGANWRMPNNADYDLHLTLPGPVEVYRLNPSYGGLTLTAGGTSEPDAFPNCEVTPIPPEKIQGDIDGCGWYKVFSQQFNTCAVNPLPLFTLTAKVTARSTLYVNGSPVTVDSVIDVPNGSPFCVQCSPSGSCGTLPPQCNNDGNCGIGESCGTCGDCLCVGNCGNSVVEGSENCDDGNTTAGDGCSAQCQREFICGNRIIQPPGEECDSTNLGGKTCQSLGFAGGTLRCSMSCRLDTSGCTGGSSSRRSSQSSVSQASVSHSSTSRSSSQSMSSQSSSRSSVAVSSAPLSSGASSVRSRSFSSIACTFCGNCGQGANFPCDQAECTNLGLCVFTINPSPQCSPDPSACPVSSTSRSSASSRSASSPRSASASLADSSPSVQQSSGGGVSSGGGAVSMGSSASVFSASSRSSIASASGPSAASAASQSSSPLQCGDSCDTCGSGPFNFCDWIECQTLGDDCEFIDGTLIDSCVPDPVLCPQPSSASSLSRSSVSSNTCNTCASCGAGVFNLCDAQECDDLGDCAFVDGLLIDSCGPDPLKCGGGASSVSSGANVTNPWCGNGIVEVGEDCDNGGACTHDRTISCVAWQDHTPCWYYPGVCTNGTCRVTYQQGLAPQSCRTDMDCAPTAGWLCTPDTSKDVTCNPYCKRYTSPPTSSSSRGPLAPFCGDGIMQTSEQCDLGSVCWNDPTVSCLTDGDCGAIQDLCENGRCPNGNTCGSDYDCPQDRCQNGKCTNGTACASDTDCSVLGLRLCYPKRDSSCNAFCQRQQQASSLPAFCGDKIVQPAGADGRVGTADDEQCDSGHYCTNDPTRSCDPRNGTPNSACVVPGNCRNGQCANIDSACSSDIDCLPFYSFCTYDFPADPPCRDNCMYWNGISSPSSATLSPRSSGSSRSNASSSPALCAACGDCGAGLFNLCDEQECLDLDDCVFIDGLFVNSCEPDPLQCGGGSSSAASVASSLSSLPSCTVCSRCGDQGNACDQAECVNLGPCFFTATAQGAACTPDPARCVVPASSRSSHVGSIGASSQASSILPSCTTCGTCGDGLFNICDQQECLILGDCAFINSLFANACVPDPLKCAGGASSSSAPSSPGSAPSLQESSSIHSSSVNSPRGSIGSSSQAGPSSSGMSFSEGCASDADCAPGMSCLNGRCILVAGICGNSVVESPKEECDDGNQIASDGCSADCLFDRGTCGDGIVQRLYAEQCEPSLQNIIPCGLDCRFVLTSCGDGKINPGEECDDGIGNSPAPGAHCRPSCRRGGCGDGIQDNGESCDDGNLASGDGCSRQCTAERDTSPITLPATLVELPEVACLHAADCREGMCISGKCGCVDHAQCLSNLCVDGRCIMPIAAHAPVGDTGPAAIAIMAAGAAAGWSFVRRRRGRP